MTKFQYLPWFSDSLKLMMERFDNETFPQSLLITGEKDIGKSIFANDLAKSILCLNRKIEKACGTCQSCVWIDKNSHPDFLSIASEEKSRVIKVDQIRQAIQFSQITSETGKKVIVIQNADEMNLNASNALLKTLEEPVNHCYLILVSSYPKKLPITIVSRCQRQLMSVDGKEHIIRAWLEQHASSYDSAQLEKIISLSYGRPILSHQFLSNDALPIVNELETLMYRYLQHKNNLAELSSFIVKNWHITSHVILFWVVSALKDKADNIIAKHLFTKPTVEFYKDYERFVSILVFSDTNIKQEWLVQEWLIKL